MYQEVILFLNLVTLYVGALSLEDIESPPLMIKQPETTEILFHVSPTGSTSHKPLIIKCEAKALGNNSNLTYWWEKNQVKLVPDLRISLIPDVGTLIITAPLDKDAGTYQCFAQNNLGTTVSNSFRVKKAFLDDFSSQAIVNITAEEGMPFKLECSAPNGWPKPQVYWMYASSNYIINSPRITVDPNGTLQFSNMTIRDGSMYVCGAISHYSGQRRIGHTVQLTVSPTTFKNVPTKLLYSSIKRGKALQGGSLELWCIFGGSPLPQISWVKDDKALPVPEGFLVNHNKTLRINNVTFNDEGSYTCRGSNGIDSEVKHTMEVVVQAAPQFTLEPKVINAAEGEDVELSCEASGIPIPELNWQHNGKPLNYLQPGNPNIVAKGSNKIVFTNLSTSDTGNYGCNASNTLGYIYKDVYVNVVTVGAEITEAPENVTALQGSSVGFKCRAFGFPVPKIRWFRKGRQLVSSGSYRILDNGDLNIANTTFTDGGDYICKAQNKYHTDTKTARLLIKNPTRVSVAHKQMNISEGDTAFLNCFPTSDATLSLTVEWFRGNESINLLSQERFLKFENNTLQIRHVRVQDGGAYTCNAKTELDEATADTILNVLTIPSSPKLKEVTCYTADAKIIWNQVPEALKYSLEYSTSFTPNIWKPVDNNIPAIREDYLASDGLGGSLSPWVNYTFRVVAINEQGRSQPSNSSAVCTTDPKYPFKNPENVTGRGNSSDNLIISWAPMPQIDHNGPGFHYVVKWKQVDSGQINQAKVKDWRIGELIVENQLTYKSYFIDVQASNDIGKANATAIKVLGHSGQDVPTEAPEEFKILEEIDCKTVKLSWKPVSNESIRGKFEGYKIQHWTYPSNMREETVGFDKSEVEVKSLKPFAANYIRVRSYNSDHEGPPSRTLLKVTPEGTPGKVANFTAHPLETNSFYLEWKSPEEPNGVIIGYEIYYEKSKSAGDKEDGKQTVRTPAITNTYQSTAKLTGLDAGTKYKLYITARTSKGLGEEFMIEKSTMEKPSTKIAKPDFRWDYVQEGLKTFSVRIYWIPNFSQEGEVGPGSRFYVEYREWLSPYDVTAWNHTVEVLEEDFIDLNNLLLLDKTYLLRLVAVNNLTTNTSDTKWSYEIRGITKMEKFDLILLTAIAISIILGIILVIIIGRYITKRIREGPHVVEPLSYSIHYDKNESHNPAVSGTRFGPHYRRASSPQAPAKIFEFEDESFVQDKTAPEIPLSS